MTIELALIVLLLIPQAIEKITKVGKPIRNWLERRRLHREITK